MEVRFWISETITTDASYKWLSSFMSRSVPYINKKCLKKDILIEKINFSFSSSGNSLKCHRFKMVLQKEMRNRNRYQESLNLWLGTQEKDFHSIIPEPLLLNFRVSKKDCPFRKVGNWISLFPHEITTRAFDNKFLNEIDFWFLSSWHFNFFSSKIAFLYRIFSIQNAQNYFDVFNRSTYTGCEYREIFNHT
jgi:hypothetical protein